ncbi:anti-sigma B factor antagonist [Nonomuraea thailandensis]|uniref:Anti-sigma factor antagonist n=1 Tax=Nonomuraea thailandensis TaxID=1188745 RepID=A0A9X2G6W4_9ACTN|nr:STAS domain-containing protein [Nonomuraea thailandensis]MCP2353391.1 anti-sigma B factor antagonist [Nonomuraea thailandensis]
MTQLTITVEQRSGFSLVALGGELDRQTRPGLLRVFSRLLDEPTPRIVINTRELVFCDCHGMGMLISGQRRAEERGGAVRLIGVHGPLARLLTVTQLVDRFPPYASLAQAGTWPARG